MTVICPRPHAECTILAVADTGAQVSVADFSLLRELGINKKRLQPALTTVSHVAAGNLKIVGSLECQVSTGSTSTLERIYVGEKVTRFYLSLAACKALRLVPADFPRARAEIGTIAST